MRRNTAFLSIALPLMLLILASDGRAEASNETPERAWHRVGVPGPRGDYLVWGWIRPDGQIGYYEREQPARKVGEVQNFGVDLHNVTAHQRGTFESNDPGFRPSVYGSHASDPATRGVGPPMESTDPSVFVFVGILGPIAAASLLMFVLGFRRRS